MPEPNNILAPANLFKPSEIIGILRNHLASGQVNKQVVCLRGIYLKGQYINQYFHTANDILRDESSNDELTIAMPLSLRDDLENGNVITVRGILDRSITNKGLIQVQLKVTDVEKLQDLAMSEDEIKRTELRRIKSDKGFKNVDNILESLLYQNKRPQVALIYAETSITHEDFEKGVQAARTHIDFTEFRESFAKTKAFCQLLKRLDTENFDVIAIVRGGGAGLEALDEVELLETLVGMNTAWMYGAGHEGEKLFILNIADKAIAIPHALGTYFRDITDGVIQKRNNSRAALVKEVEGQFKKQIEDSNKKNQELNKQLEALQKQNKQQTEASNKKIEELTKAQKEHDEVIKKMTAQHQKATEDANKLHKEQNETLQKANAQLQEQLKKQTKDIADMNESQKKQAANIEAMTKSNAQLQESLNKANAQNLKITQEISGYKTALHDMEGKISKARQPLFIALVIMAIIIIFLAFQLFTK